MKDDLQLGKLKENFFLLKLTRVSHRISEGCGFDSHLGLRNIFLSMR